jgi:hypothetical protein
LHVAIILNLYKSRYFTKAQIVYFDYHESDFSKEKTDFLVILTVTRCY